MDLKLTVIGSGTMIPTKDRNPSAFLLEAKKKRILLDCGHSTIRRLIDRGIDLQSIDAIFISHFHADHFGDAFNLVHARFVDDIYRNANHRTITFFGPKGLQERFALWRKIYWPEPDETYPIFFNEGAVNLSFGKIDLQTFRVVHVPWFESIGIRMIIDDKLFVYPGDIGGRHDFNDLVKNTNNADLLIIEASAKNPAPNHLTIEQVKKLKSQARIKKVFIVHIRADQEEHLSESLKDLSEIELAFDGMEIEM